MTARRLRIAYSRLLSIILFLGCLFGPLLHADTVLAEPVMITDADGQFQFAEQYLRAGEFFRAVGEYERFVYFFPDDPRKEAATHKIGLAYFKGKKFEQAIPAFKAFLAQFPSSELATETRFRICDSLIRMGSLLKAVKCLTGIAEEALDTDIADRAYYLRGWIYLELDDWEDAAESFELISKKNRERYRLEDLSREMSWKGDIKTKSPAVAGILAIIPGAGHLYCGRYRDATVAFILNSAMMYAAYEAFDHDQNCLGGLITIFELGFYTGNIYSAVGSAHKHNRAVNKGFLEYLKQNSRITLGLRQDAHKRQAPCFSCQLMF